jgi:hypothetical protein
MAQIMLRLHSQHIYPSIDPAQAPILYSTPCQSVIGRDAINELDASPAFHSWRVMVQGKFSAFGCCGLRCMPCSVVFVSV